MRFSNLHSLIEETLSSSNFSKKVLLIRHGTSLGNVSPTIHGNSEYPLTAKGEAQAAELGSHLRRYGDQIVHIRSSNLIRCLETCRLAMNMSSSNGFHEKFVIDTRIKEFGLGIWENTILAPDINSKDLEVLYSCLMKGQIKPFNGDNVEEFEKGIVDSLNEAQNGGLNLYFTHSGVIYTAMKEFEENFFIGQCGVAAFEFDDFSKEKRLIGVYDGDHVNFI
jgi:broad specificity phosphatase PhoE